MTWLDRLLAVLALIGLFTFVGVVAVFVRQPDLIIVFIIGGLLAAYDFWRSFRRPRNGAQGK